MNCFASVERKDEREEETRGEEASERKEHTGR